MEKDLKAMSFGELSDLAGRLDPEDEDCQAVYDELRTRQLAALPHPTCCQAARDYPAIVFQTDVYEGDSRKAEGAWEPSLVRAFREARMARRDLRDPPEAKFCCYCGLSLPKMVRKKKFPSHTCVVKDGGYYCSTCKERLHACRCLPPEFAFEPV